MEDKMKKRQEESIQSRGSAIVNPSYLIERHEKWKMAHTKKSEQKTSKAAQKISNRIVSSLLVLNVILYNNKII